MKKLLLLPILISLAFVSCEGDPGPPGPPGLDGLDGGLLLAQVFEYEADFNAGNNYSALFEFPSNVEVFESDVVLAYALVGVDGDVDIWEPLPRTLFFNEGILMYGYDHTFVDINFFLDGTIDLGLLDASYTQNQIFRVAVVPAEFAAEIDVTNINTVMSALNIKEVIRVN